MEQTRHSQPKIPPANPNIPVSPNQARPKMRVLLVLLTQKELSQWYLRTCCRAKGSSAISGHLVEDRGRNHRIKRRVFRLILSLGLEKARKVQGLRHCLAHFYIAWLLSSVSSCLYIRKILERIIINCDDCTQQSKQTQLARIQHSPALLLHCRAKEESLRACSKGSVGFKHYHPHQ